MIDSVTSRGGFPSFVWKVTVTVLFSGSGTGGNPVTCGVPSGDVALNRTVPSGLLTTTVI